MERARTHGEVNTSFSFIRNQNQLSMRRPSDDVDLRDVRADRGENKRIHR